MKLMKMKLMKKKYLIVGIAICLVIVILVYFFFFYTKKCSDITCFNSAMEKCSKTSYISETDEASWLYSIQGRENENCVVYVKLLQLKKGKIDTAVLENKDMYCFLPLTYVGKPEENLGRCHGLLKEEMLVIMLNNAHKYIMDNLGKISEELNKVV